MRKEVIVALMEHIATLTDEKKQPVVRHIDLWNEQVEFIEQETPFDTPAVFIELRPMRWNSLSGNVQQCNADLRFHIVTRWEGSSAKDSIFQQDALERFDILDSIDSHLNNWSFNSPQTSISMMQRIGSSTNHNHEELVEDRSNKNGAPLDAPVAVHGLSTLSLRIARTTNIQIKNYNANNSFKKTEFRGKIPSKTLNYGCCVAILPYCICARLRAGHLCCMCRSYLSCSGIVWDDIDK